MKRIIAVFSYTELGARNKAFKLMNKRSEGDKITVHNETNIETDESIYNLYKYGAQMNGIRFHEAHVNDLFSVRYANHINQGLIQQRDMSSKVHYFMSDDEQE